MSRYSVEFKNKVLDEFHRGLTRKELSIKYTLPKGTLQTWIVNDQLYPINRNPSSQKLLPFEDKKNLDNYFSRDIEIMTRNLYRLRLKSENSFHEVCVAIDICSSSWKKIETGINLPSLTVLIRICNFFHITMKELFSESEDLSPAQIITPDNLEKRIEVLEQQFEILTDHILGKK